jgi:hypothetical protein
MSDTIAERRAMFWNFGGAIVYVSLAMLAMAPVVMFCRSDMATLIGILSAMFGPAIFVMLMMFWRNAQWSKALDEELTR